MSNVATLPPVITHGAASPAPAKHPPRAIPTPLLPVAIAVTAGIVLDRTVQPSLLLTAMGFAGAALAWLSGWRRRSPSSIVWLWLMAACLGGAWHRVSHWPAPNDISRFADEHGQLVRVRGVIWTDPETPPANAQPLYSNPSPAHTSLLLRVDHLAHGPDWQPVQGYLRVSVGGRLRGSVVGDEVELLGTLEAIPPPSNPGEADWQTYFADQAVRARLHLKTPDAATLRRRGSFWMVDAWLARLRGWGAEALRSHLDERRGGVAVALVLGDQSALAPQQFEGYLRTGVFHVLAVSGQHLVILCAGLELVLRLLAVSRRSSAILLIVFVWLYALLTGAHPPVMRAAVIMTVWCGGWLVRRPVEPVNTWALAWLVIALGNPSDLFQTGCQLSFLAVLVLMTVVRPIYGWRSASNDDPVAKLLRDARPRWRNALVGVGNWFLWGLLTSLIVWLASGPLLAARFHLVSPVAIPLSPIMIPLTAVALLAGFLCLVLTPLGLGGLAAWFINISLAACEGSVWLGERIPAGFWYVGDIQEWWLGIFYLFLLAALLSPPLKRRWLSALVAGLAWLAVGLALHLPQAAAGELRCTFLAVGHGGCAVLETPDGRVLLYDTGSIGGPEVTARQIAPYLWSRGITRIDEVFLSHADLDHFNGLPALLDRFRVAQVSRTPTFAIKPTPGVKLVADLLTDRGIPTRELTKDQRLRSGKVAITILHPPADFRDGNENARSMVLLIEYAGRTLLLTGDLEQPGLGRAISRPAPRIDVMLAPHHGSPASNIDLFARWARPALVISSEGHERGRRPDPYAAYGGIVWRTVNEGAVTVIMSAKGVRAETFRTRKAWGK